MSTTTNDFLRQLRTLAARQAIGAFSDRQLLERFRLERSEASFAVLVQRHGPMVLSVCRRVLHHAQDAEDAFQATFLVLAKKAALLRQPTLLSGWLHGVAHHVALRLKAKAERRAVHEHRIDPPPPGDALDDISWRELRAVLDEELQRLPEKHRAPLVLCYLEGRTQDEAARQLGWSKSTFRRCLESGRKALGRRLTHRGVTLSAALSAPLLADATAQASLPPLLAASTVRAGLASALGNTVSGVVSAQVAALAESGVASLLTKRASIVAILLLSLTLGIGGLLAHRAIHDRTFGEAPATPKAPQPPPQSSSARSASKGESFEIKGRVLDPDGKPFVGGSVYLWTNAVKTNADMPIRVTSGRDGRFRLPIREVDRHQAVLVSSAKDHGPDWIELSKLKNGEEATLRLVKDDVPIQGRILDLEGRPVAHATVRVLKLHQTDLDWWLKEERRGRVYYPKSIEPAALDTPTQTTTAADGRFELNGLGRESLVYLMIEGAAIERIRCWALTRDGKNLDLPKSGKPIYPATFDHVAAPSKPIIGTVREKGTGKPLAGIAIQMTDHWINNAKTDARGKYRITGNPKEREYSIIAAGKPYFGTRRRHISDTPGLEPLVVDFELERGIEIRGRIVNKATGKPIEASVKYHAFADNPSLKKTSTDLEQNSFTRLDDRNCAAADGSFFVIGLPGPGMLTVLAGEDDFHKPEQPADWEKLVPYVRLAPPLVHAWVRINPSEKDPRSTHLDIALEPAKPIAGRVLDVQGKPLGGYFVTGLTGTAIMHSHELDLHADPSFQVRGVDPGRPRTVVFIHPAKKLGRVQIVRRDQRDPLQIRLEPLSAATGRILDAEGSPRVELQVRARPDKDGNGLPLLSLIEQGLREHHVEPHGTTDEGGRFRLDNLIPRLKYYLDVREAKGNSLLEFHGELGLFSAESGKTKDLGDLKSKPVPEKGAKGKP